MNEQELTNEINQKEILNLHEIICNKLNEINKLKFELAVKQNKIEVLEMMLKENM